MPAIASSSIFMSVCLKVLKVNTVKSETEIFHGRNKGSLVSYVLKIEGFLLYCQGLFIIAKGKFRGSVSFVAFAK